METQDPCWPALPYERLRATLDTLHRYVQIVGKLKLRTPFQPEWSNVALEIGPRGLGTGAIPSGGDAFSIDLDLVGHSVSIFHGDGRSVAFPLRSRPVADFLALLQDALRSLGIDPSLNLVPQEVADPVPFDQDRVRATYEPDAVATWWRAMSSVARPLSVFQGRFRGKTAPLGFMWGTFDQRVVRFDGRPADIGAWSGLIRRAAMDASQYEVGFWHGQDSYPRAALYAFTYPRPEGVESAAVRPAGARWDAALGEHLLDWDVLRAAPDPTQAVLEFAQSTYEAGSRAAGWPAGLDVFGAIGAAVAATDGEPARLAAALEAHLGRHFPVEQLASQLSGFRASYMATRPPVPWPDWCARALVGSAA
jgi:Family of unknown function (DUF5996)